MSILSQLAEGKITFSQAASQVEAWASGIVKKDPTLTAAVGQIVTDTKQAASDAVGMADTALGTWIIPASKGVETLLDTALAGATGGATVGFNPFINDGIDTIAAAIKAEADSWTLKAKAALATTGSVSVSPVTTTPPVTSS